MKLIDLQFKNLHIWQGENVFPFGTDAVLLSHFAKTHPRDRVADLGTGTGVLPLLIYARYEYAFCDAVEISPEAARGAALSVAHNGLGEKIRVHNQDLRALQGVLPHARYDSVVCNPPFTRKGAGQESETAVRAAACHETSACLADVARAANYLLRTKGRFCLVLPATRLAEAFAALQAQRLEPKRLQTVAPYEGKAPNRVLLEAVKQGGPQLTWEQPLVIYSQPGVYTPQMKEIYHLS